MKQRVYKKNKDVLMQLDHLDRIDKVEQTVGEVIGDYERLLRRMVEKAVKGEVDEGEGGTSTNGGKRDRAKRKLVIEDDEDEDDAGSSERGRKRNRED